MMERIAILAGGGTLPLVLADCIAERGGRAHIVGVRGEAAASIESYPHTWVTWGAVNAIIATLKRESNGQIMIAGHVSRPDIMRLKPDFGVIRYLPQVLSMLNGGDDAVLTRMVRFFETQGLKVQGVGDVAPQLLANAGTFGAAAEPSQQRTADCALGYQVLDTLADLDVGQAIAVQPQSEEIEFHEQTTSLVDWPFTPVLAVRNLGAGANHLFQLSRSVERRRQPGERELRFAVRAL